MAQEDVRLSGTFSNSAGTALDNKTVTAFSVGTTSPNLSTDTTDASGRWDLTATLVGRIDAQLVTGSETFRIISLDKFQVTEIHGRNPTTAQPAGQFWSTTSEASSLVAIFGFRPATESSGVETPDTPSDNDEGYIDYELSNDNATPQAWIAGRFTWVGVDVSDGSEDGRLDWDVMVAGSLATQMTLSGTTLDLQDNAITTTGTLASGNLTVTGTIQATGQISVVQGVRIELDGPSGNDGIISSVASEMGIVLNGTQRFKFSTSQLNMGQGGTESLPAYIMGNDVDSGIFRVSANLLAISTGANERMRWGSAGINNAVSMFWDTSVDSAAVADQVGFGRFEIGAGNTVIALSQETAVVTAVVEADFSHALQVRINGTTYNIMLASTLS